jgi:hypothetical protein
MFKRSRIFLFIAVLLVPVVVRGQGTNNSYPIDSVDIGKVFDMMGISIFKFPLSIKGLPHSAGSHYGLNITVEEYKNGLLDNRSNSLEDSSVYAKLGLPFSLPQIEDTGLLRMYCRMTNSSSMEVNLEMNGGYGNQFHFDIDPPFRGLHNFRAFTYSGLKEKEKTPLMVYYAESPHKSLLRCPSNAPPSDIPKLYDDVIIIYGEPVLIK